MTRAVGPDQMNPLIGSATCSGVGNEPSIRRPAWLHPARHTTPPFPVRTGDENRAAPLECDPLPVRRPGRGSGPPQSRDPSGRRDDVYALRKAHPLERERRAARRPHRGFAPPQVAVVRPVRADDVHLRGWVTAIRVSEVRNPRSVRRPARALAWRRESPEVLPVEIGDPDGGGAPRAGFSFPVLEDEPSAVRRPGRARLVRFAVRALRDVDRKAPKPASVSVHEPETSTQRQREELAVRRPCGSPSLSDASPTPTVSVRQPDPPSIHQCHPAAVRRPERNRLAWQKPDQGAAALHERKRSVLKRSSSKGEPATIWRPSRGLVGVSASYARARRTGRRCSSRRAEAQQAENQQQRS
jgi:hypothetical protein